MFKTNNIEEIIIKSLYFVLALIFAIYLTNNKYLLFTYVLLSLLFIIHLLCVFNKIEINDNGLIIKKINRCRFIHKNDIIISEFKPNGALAINHWDYFEIRIKSKKKVIGFISFDSASATLKFKRFLEDHYKKKKELK